MNLSEFYMNLQKILSMLCPNSYFYLRYADQVTNGYELLVEQNDKLTPVKVINTLSSKMEGEPYFLNNSFFKFKSCDISF